MTTVKKPQWDECKIRGLVSKRADAFSAIEGPIENGMIVFAKYKDKNVHMKITGEISIDVFEAVIIDIESNMTDYEGLSINDKVEIPRRFICWLQEK